MNLTYEQQLNLVAQGLATAKTNGKFTSFKYARRVMYDYLWAQHPELLNCRGQVYDNTNGKQISFPPQKRFNYLESGTWSYKSMQTRVNLFKKFNGFMACVSFYKGEVVISTTGTTNSVFVEYAREMLLKDYFTLMTHVGKDETVNGSWLFEICHPNDPHIVYETPGAKYLGYQPSNAAFIPMICNESSDTFRDLTLQEALEIVKNVKHEGFMMYDVETGEVCKLKSPYYIAMKKLMRLSAGNTKAMYNTGIVLPEEYDFLSGVVMQVFTADEWVALPEMQRREELENIIGIVEHQKDLRTKK